jgi:hypothetical protein
VLPAREPKAQARPETGCKTSWKKGCAKHNEADFNHENFCWRKNAKRGGWRKNAKRGAALS